MSQRPFPLVSIGKELFLVIQELLARFSGELKIRTLYDCIHGARLLAKPAVDALCHVNVVSGVLGLSVGGVCVCVRERERDRKIAEGGECEGGNGEKEERGVTCLLKRA